MVPQWQQQLPQCVHGMGLVEDGRHLQAGRVDYRTAQSEGCHNGALRRGGPLRTALFSLPRAADPSGGRKPVL
jgi:hypothetical protein